MLSTAVFVHAVLAKMNQILPQSGTETTEGGMSRKQAIFGILLSVVAGMGASAASPSVSQRLHGVHVPSRGALVFPTVSDPHFIRQAELVTCTNQSCVLSFDKIDANRLLQIDTITCSAGGENPGGGLYRNSDIAFDAAHLVVIFPIGSGGVTSVSGPYYMASGERPTIVVSSPSTAYCSIFGTLWTTQRYSA